jgi:dethiobiotin synthetase
VTGLFIAGTDTAVGKTHIATAMVRALVRAGLKVAVMKPVAAGAHATPDGLRNEDAQALISASNVPAPYEWINPYCAKQAASPHISCSREGIVVDPAVIRSRFQQLAAQADVVAVEGAGGWYAPVGDTLTMADVASAVELPVVLVVSLRLGCLSHALLTVEAIERRGISLAGWVANQVQPHFEHARENVLTLQRRLPAPLLESVSFGAQAFAERAAVETLQRALHLRRIGE